MSVYLDWNATTPPHPSVLSAMHEARAVGWANPSSVHAAGRAARRLQEDARELVARIVRVAPRDVLFTSGGTEANHLALSGASSLVLSRLEHPSITASAAEFEARGGAVRWLAVTPSGQVEPAEVERALVELESAGLLGLRPVVAVQAVNHETGVLQPLEGVGRVTRARGVKLHVDAVQLLGRGSAEELVWADSVAVASHKIRGPKGVGALAFGCDFQPLPLGRGGAQERGLRPGTQDGVALRGFAAALERLAESETLYAGVGPLRARVERALMAQPGALIHGEGGPRLAHVVNFSLPGFQGDELVAALDLEGIAVSSGSACSAGTAEPSPVIEAMLGRDVARRAVRVSLGEETTDADVDALLRALGKIGALAAGSSSV